MLVRDLFNRQLEKTPDATALVFDGKKTTWREIDSLSNQFAQGLIRRGLKKGDRVAAILTNSLEFIVSYVALLKSGGIFVPLNPLLTLAHITYALNHSETTVFLCNDDYVPGIRWILPDLRSIEQIVTVGEKDSSDGMVSFSEVLAEGSGEPPPVSLTDDDIAVFLYTAGTTGDPKGVVHTHFNCGFVAEHWARVFGMGPGKSILMVLPLFHSSGLHCVTLPALISGQKIVMNDRYNTQWCLETMEKHRIASLLFVPAMANLVINHPDFSGYDLSGLEMALIGGAIVPYELLRQWRDAFPDLSIINAYGQTESCPCSTGKWDVDILKKPRSVGKPWDYVELKILDDGGNELSPGEVGEIVYRVASVMKEYYKAPELPAETLKEGWLFSGDLGFVDEDGYVFIVDRKKDIIIRGGENISSMEVEEVLHEHPAVLEASAIGAPDKFMGETVMAVVVRRPGHGLTEEELIRFCADRLERFKIPERVAFMEDLPRNPGGKVLKRELKAAYFPKAKP